MISQIYNAPLGLIALTSQYRLRSLPIVSLTLAPLTLTPLGAFHFKMMIWLDILEFL